MRKLFYSTLLCLSSAVLPCDISDEVFNEVFYYIDYDKNALKEALNELFGAYAQDFLSQMRNIDNTQGPEKLKECVLKFQEEQNEAEPQKKCRWLFCTFEILAAIKRYQELNP
jgi:hypothetical protein